MGRWLGRDGVVMMVLRCWPVTDDFLDLKSRLSNGNEDRTVHESMTAGELQDHKKRSLGKFKYHREERPATEDGVNE